MDIDQGDGAGLAGATVALFRDTNNDGIFQPGTDTQVGSTITTNATGNWAFTSGLAVGAKYFVNRTTPTGFSSTNALPGSGTGSAAVKKTNNQLYVTLGASLPTFSANNNFLAKPLNGTITGTVYNDVDGGGTFNSGIDTGLSGVSVSLSGASTATMTTLADGSYSFTGLSAGTYSVDYTPLAGYANTGAPKPITGITLAAGDTSANNNFFARRTTSTSVALTSGTNPSTYGSSLTYTATVTSASGTNPSTGSVTFLDGSTTLCANVSLSGNTATCTPSTTLSVAGSPHGITAQYNGTTTAPGYSGSTSGSLSQTITAKQLTGSFTASNKVYDATTAAGIAGRSLSGVVGSDDVTLTGGSATFADKNVGTGKTVTGTGFSLTGTTAGNYTLASSTTTTTANITARPITVTAATNTKIYDGTTSAAATPTITSGALQGGDTADLTETFDTKNVGTGKTVTPSRSRSATGTAAQLRGHASSSNTTGGHHGAGADDRGDRRRTRSTTARRPRRCTLTRRPGRAATSSRTATRAPRSRTRTSAPARR